MSKPKLTFEIDRSKNKEFFVRIVMRNRKITFTSETYQRRQGAQRAIDGLVNALSELDFEIRDLTEKR